MKNLKTAFIAIILVLLVSLSSDAQQTGKLSPDGSTVMIERTPQRVVNRTRTITVDKTDSMVTRAIDGLTNQLRELNQDVTQRQTLSNKLVKTVGSFGKY